MSEANGKITQNASKAIQDNDLENVTGGGADPLDISDRIVCGDYGNGEAEKYQLRTNDSTSSNIRNTTVIKPDDIIGMKKSLK